MRIAGIVHLVYEAPQYLPVCVHTLWQLYGVRRQGAIRIRTAGVVVYKDAVYARVFAMGWGTAMRVAGIVHLLYEAPRDLPVCVQLISQYLKNLNLP